VSDVDLISFGIESDAMVRASDIEATDAGSRFKLHIHDSVVCVNLPLAGQHNVGNACAAAAVATALQISPETIKRGLGSVQPVSGRLQPVRAPSGFIVYNDSYNANPQSVTAAARFLASLGTETWLVLGDMGELGSDSVALHSAVGRDAQQLGVRQLLATGELSKHTVQAFGNGALWFETIETLVESLKQSVSPGATVLVKGSRSARMERVVEALLETDLAEVH
jgi:UDP-N-acetylmuramoyl-tripeptide--D-alanyl-D-alanine ligase